MPTCVAGTPTIPGEPAKLGERARVESVAGRRQRYPPPGRPAARPQPARHPSGRRTRRAAPRCVRGRCSRDTSSRTAGSRPAPIRHLTCGKRECPTLFPARRSPIGRGRRKPPASFQRWAEVVGEAVPGLTAVEDVQVVPWRHLHAGTRRVHTPASTSIDVIRRSAARMRAPAKAAPRRGGRASVKGTRRGAWCRWVGASRSEFRAWSPRVRLCLG